MSVTFRLHGLRELQRTLDSLPVGLDDEAEDVIRRAVEAVEAEARALAPVRTGRLRDSSFVEIERDGDGRVLGCVGFDAPYATFVHENPESRGFKFLEAPVEQAREPFLEDAADALWRHLKA